MGYYMAVVVCAVRKYGFSDSTEINFNALKKFFIIINFHYLQKSGQIPRSVYGTVSSHLSEFGFIYSLIKTKEISPFKKY